MFDLSKNIYLNTFLKVIMSIRYLPDIFSASIVYEDTFFKYTVSKLFLDTSTIRLKETKSKKDYHNYAETVNNHKNALILPAISISGHIFGIMRSIFSSKYSK